MSPSTKVLHPPQRKKRCQNSTKIHKNTERGKIEAPYTQIHDPSLPWFRTDTVAGIN
jgi:hypothetical protein